MLPRAPTPCWLGIVGVPPRTEMMLSAEEWLTDRNQSHGKGLCDTLAEEACPLPLSGSRMGNCWGVRVFSPDIAQNIKGLEFAQLLPSQIQFSIFSLCHIVTRALEGWSYYLAQVFIINLTRDWLHTNSYWNQTSYFWKGQYRFMAG